MGLVGHWSVETFSSIVSLTSQWARTRAGSASVPVPEDDGCLPKRDDRLAADYGSLTNYRGGTSPKRIAGSVVSLFAPDRRHSLRHSDSPRTCSSGAWTFRIIQILLGHSSLRSTEIYTHLTEPLRDQLRTLLGQTTDGLFEGRRPSRG